MNTQATYAISRQCNAGCPASAHGRGLHAR